LLPHQGHRLPAAFPPTENGSREYGSGAFASSAAAAAELGAEGTTGLVQKASDMPKFKKRPIGRTGHRFILEHSFVTKSGNTYSGFSLQYPKVFGFRSEKSKDMGLLVSNRNVNMARWAEQNTTLSPAAIEAWIAALDEGGVGATGGT
jgi:hypothetical protein